MVVYDVESSLNDDIHENFHNALSSILVQWREVNHKNSETIQNLNLSVFSKLIVNLNQLEDFQVSRLKHNLEVCVTAGHFSKKELAECLKEREDKVAIIKQLEIEKFVDQKMQ